VEFSGGRLKSENVRKMRILLHGGGRVIPRGGIVRNVCMANSPEGEPASATEKVLAWCVTSGKMWESCARGYTGLAGTAPPAASNACF
jgi:hypothetical protein